MNKSDKLIELTKKKMELIKEISELDLIVAKKKDAYRKIVIEINMLDHSYFKNKEVH